MSAAHGDRVVSGTCCRGRMSAVGRVTQLGVLSQSDALTERSDWCAGHTFTTTSANNAVYAAGLKALEQRLIHAAQPTPRLTPISTVKLTPLKGSRPASDAGGAHSGRSDTTQQALQPASATAAHAATLLSQEPASPDSVVTAPKASPGRETAGYRSVPDPVPLPPPDASEGPEAEAEYEAYLQRWNAGDTLAQRWHR